MFLSRNKKINLYPCKPQFYCIKVGFKGVKSIGMFSLHFVVRMKKLCTLCYLTELSEDSDGTTNAQADLNLSLGDLPQGMFSEVKTQICSMDTASVLNDKTTNQFLNESSYAINYSCFSLYCLVILFFSNGFLSASGSICVLRSF